MNEDTITLVWKAVAADPDLRVWEIAEKTNLGPSVVFHALGILVEWHVINQRTTINGPRTVHKELLKELPVVHQWPALPISGELSAEGIKKAAV